MGFFDKIKKLAIFSGFTKLDDSFYDELEESLILADMGMDTTLKAVEELRRRVRAALARLPDDFRQVLLLRELGGLSYDEIAAALSLEVGTVKSRLNRARKKLCTALLESGNFSDRFPSKQGKGCEA